MKTVKFYRTALLLTFLFSSHSIFANDFGIFNSIDGLLDAIRQNAGKVFALIFLASCIFNIGKITGSDRDYKGFFVGVLLWVVGISVVAGIFAYLLTLSF